MSVPATGSTGQPAYYPVNLDFSSSSGLSFDQQDEPIPVRSFPVMAQSPKLGEFSAPSASMVKEDDQQASIVDSVARSVLSSLDPTDEYVTRAFLEPAPKSVVDAESPESRSPSLPIPTEDASGSDSDVDKKSKTARQGSPDLGESGSVCSFQ